MQTMQTRNTVFALLMGLEQDLRRVLIQALSGKDSPLTPQERDNAADRRSRSGRTSGDTDWTSYVDFLDLNELLDVVTRSDQSIESYFGNSSGNVRDVAKKARQLVPIRNRVCHARPLESTDLPTSLDVV